MVEGGQEQKEQTIIIKVYIYIIVLYTPIFRLYAYIHILSKKFVPLFLFENERKNIRKKIEGKNKK